MISGNKINRRTLDWFQTGAAFPARIDRRKLSTESDRMSGGTEYNASMPAVGRIGRDITWCDTRANILR